MQPSQPGPRRKYLRETLRGVPAGRHTTHPYRSPYLARQRECARITAWTRALQPRQEN